MQGVVCPPSYLSCLYVCVVIRTCGEETEPLVASVRPSLFPLWLKLMDEGQLCFPFHLSGYDISCDHDGCVALQGYRNAPLELCVVMCIRIQLSSASAHNATKQQAGSSRGVMVEVVLGDDFLPKFMLLRDVKEKRNSC
ncbi:hypothetical protein INR49_016430 [Caranx melampygus]|nr:hypothetical protein INR49_016430 [Caranx melampygus]